MFVPARHRNTSQHPLNRGVEAGHSPRVAGPRTAKRELRRRKMSTWRGRAGLANVGVASAVAGLTLAGRAGVGQHPRGQRRHPRLLQERVGRPAGGGLGHVLVQEQRDGAGVEPRPAPRGRWGHKGRRARKIPGASRERSCVQREAGTADLRHRRHDVRIPGQRRRHRRGAYGGAGVLAELRDRAAVGVAARPRTTPRAGSPTPPQAPAPSFDQLVYQPATSATTWVAPALLKRFTLPFVPTLTTTRFGTVWPAS